MADQPHEPGQDRNEITHYSVMGLPEDVSDADIRVRYLELANTVRPTDEVDDRSLLLTLNEAYQVLKDQERRRSYDEWLERDRYWRKRQRVAERRRHEGVMAAEASHTAWAARQEANRQERAEAEARRAELQRLAEQRRAEAALVEAEKRLTLLDEARAGTSMTALDKLQLYGWTGLFAGWLAYAAVAAWFRDGPGEPLSGLETSAALGVGLLAVLGPYAMTKLLNALFKAIVGLFRTR